MVPLDEVARVFTGDVLLVPVFRAVKRRADIQTWFVGAARWVSLGELLFRKHRVGESDHIDGKRHTTRETEHVACQLLGTRLCVAGQTWEETSVKIERCNRPRCGR